MTDETKLVLDLSAVGAAGGAVLSVLPDIAAAFTVIWLGLRIWESETVKRFTGRGV